MAFTLKNIFPNVSRYSNAARSAAEMANAILTLELSGALTAAGCATATTTTKAKTANTLTYTVGGKFFSKGATDNFWTLSGTTVAASSWQKYLLMIDTSGNASVQEGKASIVSAAAVTWTNVSNVSPWAAFLAAVGSTKAVVGVLTIATDASHTFVPGTTALNATGITATFADGIDQSILPLMANQTGAIVGNGG